MFTPDVTSFAAHDSRVVVGSLNGFNANRRFTDLFCCLSYIILISSCAGIVYFNQHNSVPDFNKLRDSSHNPCTGVNKYLYFPTKSLQKSVCVSNCPQRAGEPVECYPNEQFPQCPVSISGLVMNSQLGICHHPKTKIPISSYTKALDQSLANSKSQILKALIIVAVIAAIIAISSLIFPSMVYVYVVLFQILTLILAIACFYRFFGGRLPFIDTHYASYYKNSYCTLGLGIFFLISFIISMSILGSRHTASFTMKVIDIARKVVMDNVLIIFDAVILTALAFGAFLLNYWLYLKIQSFGYIDENDKGINQYKGGLAVNLLRILFLAQALWTHGFIISLSRFVFEAKATLWYYTPVLGTDTCYSIITTIRLVFWHFGTICYGSVNTYYSQTFTNAINISQRTSDPVSFEKSCYSHNSCFRYLSIYGLIPTILEGLPFWPSNHRFTPIKAATQTVYPQLYMQGSFFSNCSKFFTTALALVMAYSFLVSQPSGQYVYLTSLVLPLVVTGFVAHEIGTIWFDIAGTIGDTVIFNRVIDTTPRGNQDAIYLINQGVNLNMISVY